MTADNRAVIVIDPEHSAAMRILAGRKKEIRKIETFDEGEIMSAEILYYVLARFGLLERWRARQHNFSDGYRF